MIIENYKKKFNIENQQQHHSIRKRKRQNSPMSTEIVSNIDQQNELQYVKSSGEIRDAKQRRPAQEPEWVHTQKYSCFYTSSVARLRTAVLRLDCYSGQLSL